MEQVILVDNNDNEVGTMEKLEAHQKGLLHRAISVVVFNSKGELLLQKRSRQKYHSGGLWTNACCSHPRPGEPVATAARRRLKEEMGIDVQPEYSFTFTYRAELGNNLTEHEVDHVFTAIFDGQPIINTDEVEDWKFADLNSIRADIARDPKAYTHWFKLMADRLER